MLIKKKYPIDKETFSNVISRVASLLKFIFNNLTLKFSEENTSCYIDLPSKHLMLHLFATKTKYCVNIISDVPGYTNKNIEISNTWNNFSMTRKIFNKIIILLNI